MNSSKYSASINSDTIGSPVASLAATRISNPADPIPWKAYGDVLGLNAPPLNRLAPAALAALAISITCSLLSTEHGPAITARCPPPILTPPTSITESSGWKALLANLYGSDTCMTFSTAGSTSIDSGSTFVVSPIIPITDCVAPFTTFTLNPNFSTDPDTFSTSSLDAVDFITIIILLVPFSSFPLI
ncbi:Uncharacterised protein [uncultured Clostridium sp.]|nr:Uncharacterised protein [uncultured Clostridium sp.]